VWRGVALILGILVCHWQATVALRHWLPACCNRPHITDHCDDRLPLYWRKADKR